MSLDELDYCGPPDSKYMRRMATFHDFDPLALWGFLTSGSYALVPPGRTLLAEGSPSEACYLTINGAVEKVLLRGDRRIRVGLAGPGKAFGYEGLIDGLPSPVTAITRERSLVWCCPATRSPSFTRARTPSRACSSTWCSATWWRRCARRCDHMRGSRPACSAQELRATAAFRSSSISRTDGAARAPNAARAWCSMGVASPGRPAASRQRPCPRNA